MTNRIANINGEIYLDENQARISVFDRSYLYGDSLYEVVRTYQEKPFLMKEHLDRLMESARLAQMDLGEHRDRYEKEMTRTMQTYWNHLGGGKTPDLYCRLVVSRGAGQIGFSKKLVEGPPLYSIIVQPCRLLTSEMFEQGRHFAVVDRQRNAPRALDPAMKSGNYLNCVLALLEAQEMGAEDALLCDAEGFVTEGSTFNIFYIKRGIVVTSPLEIGILNGLTRKYILALCEKLQIPYRITRFSSERLQEADEIFMASTTFEVFPVTRLNHRTITNGRPGPITRRLAQAFHTWALEQCS